MKGHKTSSQQLAQFVAGLGYEDIPPDVRHRVKTGLLDVIGNACGGLQRERPKLIVQTIRALDSAPHATIWGLGAKVSCPYAALVNSALACGADFSYGPVAEIGAGVIPAAFVLAERDGSSGRDLLVAMVAGHEVIMRLIAATPAQTIQKRGFYHSGIQCPPAAAAAAGKMLGLTDTQLDSAISLGAASGTGTMAMFKEGGGQSKYFFVGRAPETGVLVAELAARGYTCPPTIIEDFYLPVYSAPDYDAKMVTYKLGEEFLTKYTRFKMNPSCLHTHTAIEATLRLLAQNGPAADEVERVVVQVSTISEELVGSWREIKTQIDAQYSIPFLVAFVLRTRRRPRVDDFTPKNISDPATLKLAGKVEVLADKEIDKREGYGALPPFASPCVLTMYTKDGRDLRMEVERPKGTYPDLPTDDELVEKFSYQAALVFPARQVDAICRMVMELESVPDVRQLANELNPGQG